MKPYMIFSVVEDGILFLTVPAHHASNQEFLYDLSLFNAFKLLKAHRLFPESEHGKVRLPLDAPGILVSPDKTPHDVEDPPCEKNRAVFNSVALVMLKDKRRGIFLGLHVCHARMP